MAELCMDGGRPEEASAFAASYLGTGDGKSPLARAGPAHAVRVRALSASGKPAEAEAAFLEYRRALPGAEGLGPVGKSVGDAWLAAGKPADALARYREAWTLLPRPLKPGAAGTVQALVEALVFAGEIEEARKVAGKAVEATPDESDLKARLRSVLRRVEMVGHPLPLPALDRWVGGAPPSEADLRGKVVVWHLFSSWMNPGPTPLEEWAAAQPERAAKGLVLLPVTRTGGWDAAAGRFVEGRKPEDEVADIEKEVRALGWKGLLGVTHEGAWFNALFVRGLPMEIVVGRDGKVVFCQAASDSGHRLAVLAAERALAAPAPETGAPSDGR
jgi:hypothetical protein